MRTSTLILAALAAAVSLVSPAGAQDRQAQLWDASFSGDTTAIAHALDGGAKIDSLDTRQNPNGRRALNWAAYNNRAPAVQLLITRGASLNLTNNTGFTPVHHAAEAGSADAMAILLKAGADISIPNNAGNLPLDTARERGHTQIVQLLESAQKRP